MILRRPAYVFLFFLAAAAAPLGLEGCTPDCSAVGLFCEGDVLVACVSRGYYVSHLERTEHPCGPGEECVDSGDRYAACAVRDPACVATSYCKGDRVVTCEPGFPGYADRETACSPYPLPPGRGRRRARRPRVLHPRVRRAIFSEDERD